MPLPASLSSLLIFWYGSDEPSAFPANREEWWQKNADFDTEATRRFLDLHTQAVAGTLEDWRDTPLGCLGLILLFDQLPRNMFRDTPRAFATDNRAREITSHVLNVGFDANMPDPVRLFYYIPLEHSEDLDDQNTAIALMQDFKDPDFLNFAEQHRVIIKRFGRFPHRNDILGRTSTAEEIAFLQEPNSSF